MGSDHAGSASGGASRISRRMAAIPAAGPRASIGKDQAQPTAATRTGTSWMLPMVSRNPSEVCRVKAVPTACRGATSVTMALNWAESATTKNPQTQASGASTQSTLVPPPPVPRGSLH